MGKVEGKGRRWQVRAGLGWGRPGGLGLLRLAEPRSGGRAVTSSGVGGEIQALKGRSRQIKPSKGISSQIKAEVFSSPVGAAGNALPKKAPIPAPAKGKLHNQHNSVLHPSRRVQLDTTTGPRAVLGSQRVRTHGRPEIDLTSSPLFGPGRPAVRLFLPWSTFVVVSRCPRLRLSRISPLLMLDTALRA